MMINVYQIKDIDSCDYSFSKYEKARERGFDLKDYEKVYSMIYIKNPSYENNYSSVITDGEKLNILEELFIDLNGDNKPESFIGHSLSVSDVVSLGKELYYCDTFGWTKIN